MRCHWQGQAEAKNVVPRLWGVFANVEDGVGSRHRLPSAEIACNRSLNIPVSGLSKGTVRLS